MGLEQSASSSSGMTAIPAKIGLCLGSRRLLLSRQEDALNRALLQLTGLDANGIAQDHISRIWGHFFACAAVISLS